MELAQSTNWFPKFFLTFIAGFTTGVALSSLFSFPPLIALFLVLVGVAVLVGERFHRDVVSPEVWLMALLLISLGLGSLRYAIKDFHEPVFPTGKVLSGVVISEPEDRDNSRRFVMREVGGEKVFVSAPLYHPVEYGDQVQVSGTLRTPEAIADEETGRTFNYPEYLAKDDIYFTLSFAEVEVLGSGHGNAVKSFLFKVKRSFIERSREILSEPYSSLIMGLIVAGRDALPAGILEEFRRAGVIHIVVLSGFNITLIAEFMRRVFQAFFIAIRFSRFPQAPALASVLGVILFVTMTGGEATVVRAALMALVVILARFSSRPYSAPRALLVAGFLMVMENPKILIYDPSFQLSFLATLGLIYLTPLVDKVLGFLKKVPQFREIISQTIATQIAVLPLLIYSMGDVSLVSLPANILILIIIPWTMFLGFLAVVSAYLLPVGLATLLAYPAYLLLAWILWVSQTLGNLSFASIKIPPLSFWVVLLAYLLLAWFIWKRPLRDSSPHSAS